MALQPTDNYIVERDETLYSVQHRILKQQMEDTDLLAVGRGDTNYKVTWAEIKDDLSGGGSIPDAFPSPDQITAVPDFQSGNGSSGNPYRLKDVTVSNAGGSALTEELITVDVGGEGLQVINFQVQSGDQSRFEQEPKVTSNVGVWTGRLVYQDIPPTTVDRTYYSTLKIGDTWFKWNVIQKVLTEVAPDIASISLVESNPDADPRFTDQEFVATVNMTEEGDPVSTKVIDAYVEGSITTTGQFEEPLESSGGAAGETWSDSLTGQGGWSMAQTRAFDGFLTTFARAASPLQDQAVITWTLSQAAADILNTSTGLQWYQVSGDGNPSGQPCAVYRNTISAPFLLNSAAGNSAFPLNLYAGTGVINNWVAGDKLIATGWDGVAGGDILYGILVTTATNSFFLKDGEPNTFSLNFAAGTDMSLLEAGDSVVQAPVQFDEPLESTTKENVDLYTAGSELNNPENAFDGDLTTRAQHGSGANRESRIFRITNTADMPNTGQGGLRILVESSSGGGSTGQQEVRVFDQNNSSLGSITLSPQGAPTWFEFTSSTYQNKTISQVTIKNDASSNNYAFIYGVEIDGVLVQGDTLLNFAAGTDMTTLKAGDTVEQPEQEIKPSNLWSAFLKATSGFNSPATRAFDGDFDEAAVTISAGEDMYFEPGGTWTGTVSFRPATYNLNIDYDWFINRIKQGTKTPDSNGLITFDVNAAGSFGIRAADGSQTSLSAMYFDGGIMIDNQPITVGANGTVGSITDTSVTLSSSSGTWTDGVNVTGPNNQPSGTVGSVNGTSVNLSADTGGWVDGANVTGPQKTITIDNVKRYLKFDSNGNVSDLLSSPQDPPYTNSNVGATITLKFPSTFPSGEAPDTELGDGTTLTVSAYAGNSAGSTGQVQATVQPEGSGGGGDVDLTTLTTLYTGTGSQTNVVTGIDIQATGGMYWIKNRESGGTNHTLVDTLRGAPSIISSNSDGTEFNGPDVVRSFTSDGFEVVDYNQTNESGKNLVAWGFQKAAGFFDVVAYTGNGPSNVQTMPHDLGTEPGCIMIKQLDNTNWWNVYHHAYDDPGILYLNSNDAFSLSGAFSSVTDTEFSVTQSNAVNEGGKGYIAYLFAKDSNVIKCDFYRGTSNKQFIDTGFTPQWVLVKNASNTGDWMICDDKRGNERLRPNTTDQGNGGDYIEITTGGFNVNHPDTYANGNKYIYIAIAAPTVRSLTQEEFEEQRLKFGTYDHRKHVHCAEQAEAERDALITYMAEQGYDLNDILKYV